VSEKRRVRVLFSHPHLLAISKPDGIPFHAEGKNKGILQIIREMEEAGEIEAGERLYPVHRLDKITSGILLFARGRKSANALSNEFRHNRVEKIYTALSDRPPSKKQGCVIGDMTKGRSAAYKLLHSLNNPATTCYLTRAVKGARPGLRLFMLRPYTGRTHQIRVAMKSLGSPVLGDDLYDRYEAARQEERAYLHATALRIRLEGKLFTFVDRPFGGLFDLPEVKREWNAFGDIFQIKWPSTAPRKKAAHKKR
jgi:tRNA pseudouridine32 synthase/23S rRNA pseudouridine746 synthase